MQVIVGGSGGGGAFIGGAAAATGSSSSAPAAEAPPVEEKKEEKEESDDDMGFSLFDQFSSYDSFRVLEKSSCGFLVELEVYLYVSKLEINFLSLFLFILASFFKTMMVKASLFALAYVGNWFPCVIDMHYQVCCTRLSM